jgi:Transglycosylase SLT domain
MSLLYTSEKKYLPVIDKYSLLISSVDPDVNVEALVLAHMKQESKFNPNAYRAEPAINDASTGLMLLGTANEFENVTTQDLYDPETNIRIAMKLIAKNLSDYGNNITDAIAAYNSGSVFQNSAGQYTNSQGDLNVQNYVDIVYANYNSYVSWIASNTPSVNIAAATTDVGAVVVMGLLLFLGVKYVSR